MLKKYFVGRKKEVIEALAYTTGYGVHWVDFNLKDESISLYTLEEIQEKMKWISCSDAEIMEFIETLPEPSEEVEAVETTKEGSLKVENVEITNKIKELIQKLLIKEGFLVFETEKAKYYNLSKFMISVYEDNYKFEIDIINQACFKIEKIYGEQEIEKQREILKNYTIFIDSIYQQVK